MQERRSEGSVPLEVVELGFLAKWVNKEHYVTAGMVEVLDPARNILFDSGWIGENIHGRYGMALAETVDPHTGKIIDVVTGTGTGIFRRLTPDQYAAVLHYNPKDFSVEFAGLIIISTEYTTVKELIRCRRTKGLDGRITIGLHGHDDEIVKHAEELKMIITAEGARNGSIELAIDTRRVADEFTVEEILERGVCIRNHGIITLGRNAQEAISKMRSLSFEAKKLSGK